MKSVPKIWTPEDAEPEFELTPMIDVVFLLIAFFMTLMSLISAELIELELPTAEEATIPTEAENRQYISIESGGNFYLGSEPIPPEQLTAQLAALKTKQPNLKLYLRADATTRHRYISQAMQACAQAGITDLIFATNQD